jgi:uncharacterized protein YbbK (DUF523 family)
MSRKETVLVSSCLVGLCTRYDSQTKISPSCMERIGTAIWIPVCPEQLGGLPTPRPPADIIGGTGLDVVRGMASVHCKDGTDVSAHFIRGAHQVLEIARRQKISRALLKARSPSCGVARQGVTAALLLEQGIMLEEFD